MEIPAELFIAERTPQNNSRHVGAGKGGLTLRCSPAQNASIRDRQPPRETLPRMSADPAQIIVSPAIGGAKFVDTAKLVVIA